MRMFGVQAERGELRRDAGLPREGRVARNSLARDLGSPKMRACLRDVVVLTANACRIQYGCAIATAGLAGQPRMPGNSLVASVAQLVEQLTLNQLVLGSSPSRGTNKLPTRNSKRRSRLLRSP